MKGVVMADRMQKYVTVIRQMPAKRAVAERRTDHREIYGEFSPLEAATQASRCEQCGVPYCQTYCPLHNNIPDWLKMTAEGRLREAYELAQATNNFPEICGRICPQDKLCEAQWACTLEQAGHDTVTIGAIERFITETAWKEGWVEPRRPPRERGERIAIVGAGPAGMAAAEELRAQGFQVHLYDRHERMGGLMMYGIPGFKLEKAAVQRREALLLAAGVQHHGGVSLGQHLTLEELRSDHDAVVLAVGAYQPRMLGAPGADLQGVCNALDYLVDSSRSQIDPTHRLTANAAGARVVVIGGGDTAMDCVRTAVRQGATEVTCLYRRDRTNMPGSAREVAHAEEEGVEFDWQAQPEALHGVPVTVVSSRVEELIGRPRVVAVRAVRTRLSAEGRGDRIPPEPIPGTAFELTADLVINALGFDVQAMDDLSAAAVATNRAGTIQVQRPRMATSVDGVFAAGDAVRGPSLVVWAIREGRDAANGVMEYFAGRPARAAQRS